MANEDQAGPDILETNGASIIMIGERYRLLPDSRLPELDLAGAEGISRIPMAQQELHPTAHRFGRPLLLGEMTEDVERMLKKLDKIPVDIEPQYMAEKYAKK